MYADILSSVLNDWVDELSGPALIDFAQVCRVQMLESSGDRRSSLSRRNSPTTERSSRSARHTPLTPRPAGSLTPKKSGLGSKVSLTAIGIDLVSSSGDGAER